MTDHPALFQTSMVLAILHDLKNQTRREKHLRRFRRFGRISEFGRSTTAGYDWHFRDQQGRWQDLKHEQMLAYLPWHVGDRLWVRETLRRSNNQPDLFVYAAGGALVECGGMNYPTMVEGRGHVASIHMPRFASRFTLNVTNVRIERLQDISRGDAMDEGCPFSNMAAGPNPRDWYRDLWDSINGAGAWDANPWVPAYTFTVARRNIDEAAHAAA
jgi:hypothetical protein